MTKELPYVRLMAGERAWEFTVRSDRPNFLVWHPWGELDFLVIPRDLMPNILAIWPDYRGGLMLATADSVWRLSGLEGDVTETWRCELIWQA